MATMDTTVQYRCDNTNSVKYIIEHKEYSLFDTRTFSDKDSAEFLLFAPPEQLSNLSERNTRSIFEYAQENLEKLREEMLIPLFEKGLVLNYNSAKLFASKDMVQHLEILLSKYEYTQDQYLELWQDIVDEQKYGLIAIRCHSKCQKIIPKYFNDEAIDKLRKIYISEKKNLLFGTVMLILFFLF